MIPLGTDTSVCRVVHDLSVAIRMDIGYSQNIHGECISQECICRPGEWAWYIAHGHACRFSERNTSANIRPKIYWGWNHSKRFNLIRQKIRSVEWYSVMWTRFLIKLQICAHCSSSFCIWEEAGFQRVKEFYKSFL